jgi:hypothetical protein
METGDVTSSSDLAVLTTRAIHGQWEYTYILEDVFDSAPVIIADAQTEVSQDRYEGLVAIFGTARRSNLGLCSKTRKLTLLDDLSGCVRKDMSSLSFRNSCNGEDRRYT